MGLWDSVKKFVSDLTGGPDSAPEPAESGPRASDVLQEMQKGKRRADPDWAHLRNRFATLVLSEADQQRLWKRAHRGADDSARLLSGITSPTPDEKRILAELVRELESGR